MKLRLLVGISLFTFTFVLGNILLFGLVTPDLFFLPYFLFMLVFFALLFAAVHSAFKQKASAVTAIIMFLVLSFSVAFLADSVKSYHETWQKVQTQENSLKQDMAYIQEKNDYFAKYVEYQTEQIKQIQSKSNAMQAQIDKQLADAALLEAQASTVAIAVPPEPLERFEENEREESDD